MNKRSKPIAWHEECLRNIASTISGYEKDIDRLQSMVDRIKAEHVFYAEQITAAKARGKPSFDADQFMKRKGKA